MSDQQYAVLCLNTFEATSINTSKSQMVFTGVDWRRALGDLYDKYEHFNLQLTTVISDDTSASLTTVNRNALITLQGPQFINSNYDLKRRAQFGPSVIGALLLGTDGTPYIDSRGGNKLTFLKREITDITVTFLQVLDKTVATGTYPNVSLVFNIWGVGQARNIHDLEVNKKLRVV